MLMAHSSTYLLSYLTLCLLIKTVAGTWAGPEEILTAVQTPSFECVFP